MTLRDDLIAGLERENDMLRERVRQLEELLGFYCPVPLEFQLTRSEAAVFGALLAREVVTNDTLMAALYRDCARDEADPDVFKVFVHKVRKKLKPFGLTIETIWGTGYRLTAASKTMVRQQWPEVCKPDQLVRPAA
ncbi:helix-turn-helix domain-containing protein [Bradyrhizobium oligotrophicum S58]